MLTLQSLTAANFRSWKKLSFVFEPGLTILLGANGAGKTSIRHSAQYALTGAVPNLRKADLQRNGTGHNAAFGVTIMCTIDGIATTIKRGKGGTSVQQQGEEYNVRDASFMDRVKLATGFSFLSAEQAHFVDVQEFKRKEMLTSLIREVDFLRNKCVPYNKRLLEVLNDKKIKVGHDIDSMYILREEIEASLIEARGTASSEKRRIDGLQAQAAVGLPMTPDAYNQAVLDRHNAQEEVALKRTRVKQGTDWVQKAYKHNERVADAAAGISRTQNAIAVAEVELQGVLERLSDAAEALSCPSCQGVMVCSSCGKRIVTGVEKQQKLENRRSELTTTIAQETAGLAELQQRLQGKLTAVTQEEIQGVVDAVAVFGTEIVGLDARIKLLGDSIHEYEVANARAQELYKVADHKEHLQRLLKNIRTITARLADVNATIARKSKTLTVIDTLMGRLRQANVVMNEVMPSVYFNIFLSRLNDFCNFLLSQISSMQLELGANEDGITIKVNDKEVKQLSSGERQRVRIATTLAFSLMAPGTDTLFIDEVFDSGLDNEGVQALALLLSTHMKSFFRNIIMISHQPALSAAIGADRVINVFTNGEGESVLQTTFAREVL